MTWLRIVTSVATSPVMALKHLRLNHSEIKLMLEAQKFETNEPFAKPMDSQVLRKYPMGIGLSLIIAAISLFIENRFGGPVMLYALIIGILCHPMASQPVFKSGISFSENHILKIGVALLGAKITIIDVANLGYQTAALVMVGVASTLVVGTSIGRLFGQKKQHAVLSAGSVAICGSSAALAIACVLPQTKETQQHTIITIIVVTLLSTLAMVLYPLIANSLALTDTQAGIFMGATIHNVAQVVGAGYMVSDPAGEIATVVKLMRVACLLPIILIIGIMFRSRDNQDNCEKKTPLLPFFMIAFIAIMLINSFGLLSAQFGSGISHLSRWALVMAVGALGVKTSVKDLVGVGAAPIIALSLQTLFLAALAMTAIMFVLTV